MAFVPDAAPETKSRFVPDAPAAPVVAPPAPPVEKPTVSDVEAQHDVMAQSPGEGVPDAAHFAGVGRAAVGALSNIPSAIPIVGPALSEKLKQATPSLQPRDTGEEIASGGMAAALPFLAVRNKTEPAPGTVQAGTGKTAVETGRAAGFKYTPGGVESRMPSEALSGDVPQSFATSPNDRRAINLHNQARATELAGKQIGKEGAKSIAPGDYDTAKKPHQQVYTDTGATLGSGLKGSDDFVSGLQARLADNSPSQLKGQVRSQTQRILNAAQSGNMSGPQMIKDMSWLRANGGRSVAKMVENEVETQLGENSPQLTKFRDARTALAQINNLQEVTKGGQIDARALARLDEANPGMLTGNLKIIAQSAAASPQDFGLPSGVKPGSSPISKPTLLGGAKAVAGKVAKTVMPGKFDVTSDAFQNRFGRVATPQEQAAMVNFARRVAPEKPFDLQPPPGEAAGAPVQRGMELPEGPPPAPALNLTSPEGAIGEGPSRQLGMEISQGRPIEDQKLGLKPPEGTAHEPHQPSLLGHPGTPEGGGKKAKKRG